jgi:hypothetical protein
MDRLKRVTGMAKGLSAVPAQKNEDESLVLFGELYRHEKEKDVNLLEPMYSVEFEAIQGESFALSFESLTCSCWHGGATNFLALFYHQCLELTC